MSLRLQNFDIREADWESDSKVLLNLRKLVFVVEQKVSPEEEFDNLDDTSWHWLVHDKRGHPIGTGRLLDTGQIGRMAVLENHRGEGVGAAVLDTAVEKARALGFEEVFLNAQVHALGFYEKAGFTATGEPFDEAGIKHQKMVRTLLPVRHDDQLHGARVKPLDANIKPFDTSEVTWKAAGKILRKVRESVALASGRQDIDEKNQTVANEGKPTSGVPIDTTDQLDSDCLHWQAQSHDGQTIGCIRMSPTGEISRLVVLEAYRNQGVGYTLIELALTRAVALNLDSVTLRAPLELQAFVARHNFHLVPDQAAEHIAEGDPSLISSPVQDLQLFEHQVELINVAEERRRFSQLNGENYDASENPYVLGKASKFLLLRREEEFKNVIFEMTAQASQSIRIWSPLLDHRLFHHRALRESFSKLARKNRYTKIEILIYDSHRIIKNSHAILEISRKLPSSISIRLVHPDFRSMNNEFIIVDNAGVIFRQDAEKYEGYANFRDITENNRLARKFRAAWETGLVDPNIRQLKI